MSHAFLITFSSTSSHAVTMNSTASGFLSVSFTTSVKQWNNPPAYRLQNSENVTVERLQLISETGRNEIEANSETGRLWFHMVRAVDGIQI
jgi:hypothetical protein